MMTQDDLKKYAVIVENGSGCFFQPLTNEYTYIITAKHALYDSVEEPQGNVTSILKANGSPIAITRLVHNGDIWIEEPIEFVLVNGQNYFEHLHADIAILKINYVPGYEAITIQNVFETETGFALCGFPDSMRANPAGDRYANRSILSFGATGNYSKSAQLRDNLNQQHIEGMSGCGILKLNQEGISLIGVQSKMASALFPAGGIGFVQALYAKEIIDYPANAGMLEKLFPSTLSNFSFLRDGAFRLEVDGMHAANAEAARITLMNQAQNVIGSDITPMGIRELFKERLLIFESDDQCLSFNAIWVAWLEFLTIMNLMKYEPINVDTLSDIFNSYRLKYVNIDDWTETDIRKEYGKSDYLGMKDGAVVIVSSRKSPQTTFKFPKGRLVDIAKPYDKTGFRTDKGIDPFTSFDFVHLDFFKKKCIANKIEEYSDLTEEQIIAKLKAEYHELFN